MAQPISPAHFDSSTYDTLFDYRTHAEALCFVHHHSLHFLRNNSFDSSSTQLPENAAGVPRRPPYTAINSVQCKKES
ncbi:hypothetical protein P8452_28272 [Trifolium repens]|nr:hypothetical protein P8452_28272 [Trifolium repens]